MRTHHTKSVLRCTFGYDITVCTDKGDLVYQTTRAISDFGADALTGCGTRVFEACLKPQGGKSVKTAEPVIWKDSWRDCDRDREVIISKRIRRSNNRYPIPEATQSLKLLQLKYPSTDDVCFPSGSHS
ncbi:hypothetical protein EDD15DRAFT_213621 [Pisolithus albus]|nr:hypothetical protein EDD15DRAFT_213621 [Pisolithus albus]